MKTLKNISLVLALTIGSLSLKAQQVPVYTHYMNNTLVVNPGYAGSRDALTVTALHRSQWVDFKGAPTTQTITAHTPLRNERLGLGLAVLNDKIGPSNNTSAIVDFAYKLKLTDKAKLAFGVGAGANIMQADLSTLDLDQQNDPSFRNNINNKVTPTVGVGLYLSKERFYAGISTPNVLQNTFAETTQANGTTVTAKEQRHYFAIAGAVFNLTENLAFKPTTLIKITAAAPIQGDLTASFIIRQKLLLGAMVRSGDAVGGLIGFDITNQLHVGYSYDWSYGLETAKYNQGSHEILLRYDFEFFNKKQIHSPRYF